MLLPIGHEGEGVRRIPWVTFTIIGLCIIIHIVTSGSVSKTVEKLEDAAYQLVEYYQAHPYLELDPETKKMFFSSEEQEEIFKSMSADKYNTGPTDAELEEQQEELNRLSREMLEARDDIPYYKWGFVPANKKFITCISSMFLHADWLHLLMNMFMLYLMGPFIEDVWGKPTYAVFYLLSGIMATLAFSMHYPNSTTPLIGASGAIAGAMGGFLIRHWNVKIRYFYFFSLFIRGTFSAPAWLMLPIWLGEEVLNARMMDSFFQGGGGVAHWAHVWGFAFGAGAALLIKFLKIEQNFVTPKVLAQTTYVNKSASAYEEAMGLINTGEKSKAYALLMDTARQDPSNQDIVESLWNMAPDMGNTDEIVPYFTRLIEKEVQQTRLDLAFRHFRDLRDRIPGARISTQAKIKLFDQAVNLNDAVEAKNLFNEVIREVNQSSPPGFILDLCSSTLKYDMNFDQSASGQVIELALRHPDIPPARKDALKEKLAGLPKLKKKDVIEVKDRYEISNPEPTTSPVSKSRPGDLGIIAGASAAFTPAVPPGIPSASPSQPPPIPTPSQPPPIPPFAKKPAGPGPAIPGKPPIPMGPTLSGNFDEPVIPSPLPPQKNFRATKAIPVGLKEKKITLTVENMGERDFPLEKIKAIAVVKITPQVERPFLLIDLMVDDPAHSKAQENPTAQEAPEILIRTIRLVSTNFNPQKFIPNTQGPLEAFKIFTSGLLSRTGAVPYPDAESVRLQKVAAFPTIKEYELSIFVSGGSGNKSL